MTGVGSERQPLRVAIIGSGPAGFYTVSNFLKHSHIHVAMDMFERLPTPFGLVRAGVAPDHQKYKTVTRAYDKSARHDNFRFFGNVTYGEHIHLSDLKQHYHQIVFCSGASSDRSLNIPGEHLAGSHSATDFVSWYNGHPDSTDYRFDLNQESAAIIGLGNVAVDVARILCKTTNELKTTDMADYALAALSKSNVKRIYMLGRRGPAQAAFTPPEIKEMGGLEDTDVLITAEEADVDEYSLAAMTASGDKNSKKNVAIIKRLSEWDAKGKGKQLSIRFLVSPLEIIGDESGRVIAIRMVKNKIVKADDGSIKARATTEEETIPVGLVFRSVGYRGVPIPNMPFNEKLGTVYNEKGRITDASGLVQAGMYTAGWIKRGPTGVIGTNKTDAQETVACMVEDLTRGKLLAPECASRAALEAFILDRQPQAVTYDAWSKIDRIELARGKTSARPRIKFTQVKDMLDVLKS